MAGGKETPRQKMIGMMYLVLTALLALNVSKSILDAFVAIEENIQKANIVQVDRGDGFIASVNEELQTTPKDAENKSKREKLTFVLDRMKQIDVISGKLIKEIDEIKSHILTESGEDISKAVDKNHELIYWKKYDKNSQVLPARMNLNAVQAKDQYDVPMHEIIGEEITNPTGSGLKLWNNLNKYRKDIVGLVGTYDWGGKPFSVNVKDINAFKDNKELTAKVKKMVEGSKTNHMDDDTALQELYMMLTKEEKREVHEVKGVHWIGATFDHSPLVAALASLSSLQQDVLSARAYALAHWKSKVSTGEYSFNKIMPLAYGPAVANANDEVELKVMMAAFDSDNNPVVTSTQGSVTYPAEGGYALVKVKAGGTTMTVSGTVSIKNKSGIKKEEKWTHEITIMKPSGSIELPELNVLYRGYPNKVDPTASGYPTTVLTGSNCSLSKSGSIYIATPGKGKEAYLTVSGRTVDGKTVTLKKVKYRVVNLPDPELYWGGVASGGKASRSQKVLFAKYPPSIPLNAKFRIIKWECQVPGAQGKPPGGPGANISAASNLLRAAKPGSLVSFICTVVGPDGIQRKKAGAFKI
ncbi:MAG: hypothetical protein HRT58_03190 [Crocinitomicaceae bacterium]|nr:hypothetical protein [Flavobacteriales bacterium]NQZ34636.1 hypothetical protein [Crocinitomicaceae bacterium]